MAKTIMVECRICKEKFNRLDPALVEGFDFVQPVKKWYYHKSCYDAYEEGKTDINGEMSEELWLKAIWDYLRKDLKGDFNYVKVRRQWQAFLKKKMTAKGMYFALRYFFEIRKNDVSKCENGIGIIPHIYEEACIYWEERENRDKGIVAAIEEQIKQAQSQNIVNVKIKKNKRTVKSAADALAAVDMEDE